MPEFIKLIDLPKNSKLDVHRLTNLLNNKWITYLYHKKKFIHKKNI